MGPGQGLISLNLKPTFLEVRPIKIVMSVRYFLILILCLGCSTQKAQRNVASEPVEISSIVDPLKSTVQIFPAVADSEAVWYYFYLQLKDKNSHYLDSNDVVIKTNNGEIVLFQKQRIDRGRYYLTLEKKPGVSSTHLNVFVQGKPLKGEFRLSFKVPDKIYSQIKLVQNEDHQLKFELHLKDKLASPVAVKDTPEIVVDGEGDIVDLKEVREGVWQFSIVYPEENQILYLSVRTMGVYLPKIFRYQHVEK